MNIMIEHRIFVRLPIIAIIGLAFACGPGSPAEPDARPQRPDSGGLPDARIPPRTDGSSPGATTHLLITEAMLAPTEAEFVEIYNPDAITVDLTNYYLSDDRQYALTPATEGGSPAPVLSTADFIAKFPDGASIGPGEVQTIAIRFGDFMTFHGSEATYGLTQVTGNQAMVPVLPITDGMVGLTNGGESIALFQWDGRTDLVIDVDLVHVGNPSSTNLFTAKNMITVDGPDSDSDPSTYRPEMLRLGAMLMGANDDNSHKRIALEDGQELQDGVGNGVFGHDEASEDLSMTWDQAPNFTPSTPGVLAPDFMP